MSRARAIVATVGVLLGTALGIIGTGLIYTAIADQKVGALLWGLPLGLGGLYWCGRALAQSQRLAARQRARRRAALQPRS
jgi:hypothetical protein